jgi:hypothetical protein
MELGKRSTHKPRNPDGRAGFLLWFYPAMDRQSLVAQFTTLLPLAAEWAAEQEQRILREGVPLSQPELTDAQAAGVQEPERVRLLKVESIPSPAHPMLRAACEATNFIPAAPRAFTVGYGICIRSDCWGNRHIVAHELVHTAQYERLGGILPFLSKYLLECATIGYSQAPMEQEAMTGGQQVCAS